MHVTKPCLPSALRSALTADDRPTLVVGIGSDHGPDQLGWIIADLVADLQLPNVTVRRALVPFDILDWMDEFAVVHLVDAMRCQQNAEAVRRWDWPACEGIDEHAKSTHGFGVVSVLRLAQALGRTKSSITIWGIEVTS